MRGWELGCFLTLAAGVACEPGGAPERTAELARPQRSVAAPPVVTTASAAASAPAAEHRAKKQYELRALGGRAPKAFGTPLAVPQREERATSGPLCEKPGVLHGFLGDEPVVATFGVQGERFTLEVVGITSGSKATFRGRSQGKVCRGPAYDFEGRKGRMERTGAGEPVKWNVDIFLPGSLEDVRIEDAAESLARPAPSRPSDAPRLLPRLPSFVTAPRRRLKIEARDETQPDVVALELWETAEDPQKRLGPYHAALRTAADIEAVLKMKNSETLLAYTKAGSRRITFAELGGSPLSVKRSTETGLVCEPFDACTVGLAGYDIGAGNVAVLVMVDGEGSRGQGHFRTIQAAIWLLTPDGFTRGAKLPEAGESNTSHGAERQHTALYWVDGDGEGPPEILAQHRSSSDGVWAGSERYPGWNKRSHELFAFDATLRAYQKVEVPPETPPNVLAKLTQGRAFESF